MLGENLKGQLKLVQNMWIYIYIINKNLNIRTGKFIYRLFMEIGNSFVLANYNGVARKNCFIM